MQKVAKTTSRTNSGKRLLFEAKPVVRTSTINLVAKMNSNKKNDLFSDKKPCWRRWAQSWGSATPCRGPRARSYRSVLPRPRRRSSCQRTRRRCHWDSRRARGGWASSCSWRPWCWDRRPPPGDRIPRGSSRRPGRRDRRPQTEPPSPRSLACSASSSSSCRFGHRWLPPWANDQGFVCALGFDH